MKSNKYAETIKWLALSLVISVALCAFLYNEILSTSSVMINEVLKTLITLFGTMLGFVLTLMAIVISLIDKRLIKNMVKSGHYNNLLMSSKLLSLLYFISIAIYLVALMVTVRQSFIFLISIGATLVTAMYSLRTAYKFFQIFKHIEPNK
ncbi:hypothetical protein ACTXJ2_09395 [Psychrobacter alimentarius]|uniref:hypothetical protein n=1 Tax=Psychrobacter TaxID=497 RepID=UPI000BAB02ED|nr:hypothetical protein [Psychrobacter sp. JB193]PAT62558.1 hypothetical protein CIK80_08175 [Psychrobacter sp. JB193]